MIAEIREATVIIEEREGFASLYMEQVSIRTAPKIRATMISIISFYVVYFLSVRICCFFAYSLVNINTNYVK